MIAHFLIRRTSCGLMGRTESLPPAPARRNAGALAAGFTAEHAGSGQMGIGTSIFLIALGAILRFAVTAAVTRTSVQTIGLILMIVGIVGLVPSLVFWTSMGPWYPGRTVTRHEDCSDGHCIA
jgi:hypothetical protein